MTGRLLRLGSLALSIITLGPLLRATAQTGAAPVTRASLVDFGAVGDGKTLNTKFIQAAIDQLAAKGGGSVVIPKGVFVSGAIFLKPGVNLLLEKDAVLKCSTDMKNFPEQRTRIEGHFEDKFNPALINADACDGLRISGEGTLDGAGRPIWDLFWKMREEAPNKDDFKNLSVPRARLCLIQNSRDVVVEGITFKDSQFWNLHLYKSRDVVVRNVKFRVPDDYKQAPSTDGIDVDSSQDVTITGCDFSVTDDCVALKGSKGPLAWEDKDSPPVERVRVSNCDFRRGLAAVTLGSEATIVRGLVVENCRVTGGMAVLNFKLRSDTPQHYEDIHYRDLTLDNSGGDVISIQPWKQYTDLKGQSPPQSVVRNISLSNVKGRYGSLGTIRGNAGQTTINDITLENIALQLESGKARFSDVKDLQIKNVTINGKSLSSKAAE